MISKLTFCVTCGRRSFHLQKSRGSACAYPAARIRKQEFIVQFAVEIWSQAGNSMDSNAPFEEKIEIAVAANFIPMCIHM
ncbi:hypothetical protein TSUD_75010 [Trifolium subterraneum]|nr:hypothetical protein TSUD_75010 [Trifolium subterraneum]